MARPSLPHPASPVVEPKLYPTREWFDFFAGLFRSMPVTGTATFAAATSVAVVLPAVELGTDYNVDVDSGENRTFWVTGKSATGFTINSSSASSATVGWTLTRR